jgi:hypothetical protein
MPLKQTPVKPVLIDYLCDICGQGSYRPNNTSFLSTPPLPPLYEHECEKCGDKKRFEEKYPILRYAVEGELLDLSIYSERT